MGKSLMIGSINSTVGGGVEANFFGSDSLSGTELNSQLTAPEDLTFSNMGGNVITLPGTSVMRFRDNSANGNQTLTWTAPGTGVQQDTVNTDVVTAGEPFNWVHSGTVGAPLYSAWFCNVEFATGHGSVHASAHAVGASFNLASTTRYLGFAGATNNNGQTNELQAQIKNRKYTSIEEFRIRVIAVRATDTVFTLRVNETDTGMTITVPGGGSTGIYTSTGSAVALSPGDRWCLKVVTGTGTDNLTITIAAAFPKSTSNSSESTWSHLGFSRTESTSSHFFPPGGRQTTVFGAGTVYTEPQARVRPGFAARLSGLRLYVGTNTCSSDVVVTLYVNGSPSALTFTITAGADDQWWEDTTHTVDIDADDDISIEAVSVGAVSGSMQPYAGTLDFEPIPASGSILPLVARDMRNIVDIGGGMRGKEARIRRYQSVPAALIARHANQMRMRA
jgi:hypothetical protein